MRKIGIAMILLFLILGSASTTFAQQSSAAIVINGTTVKFTSETGYPFIDGNNRTQVPFRVALETLGAKVDWIPETRTAVAEKNGRKVEVPIGASYIISDGERLENDTAALIKDGKTYLPIRKVMEALGCSVNWDSKTGAINIRMEYPKMSVGTGVNLIYADVLGEPRLSEDQLIAIKGNAAEMKKQINTVTDLIRYLRVNGYTTDGGDTKINEGSVQWHHNRPSWSTIKINKGNCGATASLANFVLKGKYDEVGFINHSDELSGHIYNYIKQDGTLYIIDFLQYLNGNPSTYNQQTVIEEARSFEDFAASYRKRYKPNLKYFVRYQSDEVLPVGNILGVKMMIYYQKDAEVVSIYETPEIDYVLKFTDPPTRFPDWN